MLKSTSHKYRSAFSIQNHLVSPNTWWWAITHKPPELDHFKISGLHINSKFAIFWIEYQGVPVACLIGGWYLLSPQMEYIENKTFSLQPKISVKDWKACSAGSYSKWWHQIWAQILTSALVLKCYFLSPQQIGQYFYFVR